MFRPFNKIGHSAGFCERGEGGGSWEKKREGMKSGAIPSTNLNGGSQKEERKGNREKEKSLPAAFFSLLSPVFPFIEALKFWTE